MADAASSSTATATTRTPSSTALGLHHRSNHQLVHHQNSSLSHLSHLSQLSQDHQVQDVQDAQDQRDNLEQLVATTSTVLGQPPAPPPEAAKERKKRSSGWVSTTNPNIYWRTRPSRDPVNALGLPLPPIRARARRPHAIHIVAYPPGFVPYDLRPGYNAAKAAAAAAATATAESSSKKSTPRASWRIRSRDHSLTRSSKSERKRKSRRTGSTPVGESWARIGFGKFFAPFQGSHQQAEREQDQQRQQHQRPGIRSRPPTRSSESVPTRTADELPIIHDESMSRPMSMVEAMIAGQNPAVYRSLARNAGKAAVTSQVVEVAKPVATGNGVTCSIILAEPNVFLAGFDHDGRHRQDVQAGTALLRGKLHLNVTKNVKIKAVTLKLIGKARTEWPEGIPPAKQQTFEEETLRTQVLTFFNAMHDGWETNYGNQCSYALKSASDEANCSNNYLAVPGRGFFSSSNSSIAAAAASAMATATMLAPSDRSSSGASSRRLSVHSVQPRIVGKDDSIVSSMQFKGYRIFHPGTFDYTFELPIDHHQLETTKLQFGSVRWELQATIERAGAFKPNMHGTKEVSIVRVPDQLSLETTEPISISRRWEDQLHYDIMISGKSFPIGGRIPIAFKLTPLAKVQIHKLKVYVSETIEYWTNDRRVTRRDPGRKILLLEKSAGKPLDDAYGASELNVLSGGEMEADQRSRARTNAARLRGRPLPEPTENILGDLDLGERFWGATEIEANVQLPTCDMMAKNRELRLHPDCSWKNANVFHWIKVVLRISRADPDDPSGSRRRHFEISIDSPFTVLNCKASQASMGLPEYSDVLHGRTNPANTCRAACGCPDSAIITSEGSPASSSVAVDMPAVPQAVHLGSPMPSTTTFNAVPAPDYTELASQPFRPMHLIRAPSYNPPAFDADQPPPPIEIIVPNSSSGEPSDRSVMTPPPQYDVVVGTPSHDGLADYFSRLADYGFDTATADDDDSDSTEEEDSGDMSRPRLVERRSGRVNVANPRTPGPIRAPSRSLDLQRPTFELSLASLPNRGRVGRNAAS